MTAYISKIAKFAEAGNRGNTYDDKESRIVMKDHFAKITGFIISSLSYYLRVKRTQLWLLVHHERFPELLKSSSHSHAL